ncbi:MAG: DUF6252 family protein [Flavobacterium sp.]|nr:DUF6252 family protein [Flavobacterium sp.]
MKKLARIAFVFLAVMAMSCSSSNDDGGSSSDEMYLRWTQGGTSYDIADPGTISSLSTVITASQGTDASMRMLSLWMPNNATVGTHPIVYNSGSQTDVYSANLSIGSDIMVDSASGTINITSIDADYIKGTFSFTGTDFDGQTYTITNGSFRAYSPSGN